MLGALIVVGDLCAGAASEHGDTFLKGLPGHSGRPFSLSWPRFRAKGDWYMLPTSTTHSSEIRNRSRPLPIDLKILGVMNSIDWVCMIRQVFHAFWKTSSEHH